MGRYRSQVRKTKVCEAIDGFYSDVEDLASELRDWFDNLPESLQGGEKGSTLEETASTLEEFSDDDRPEGLDEIFADTECNYTETVRTGKKYTSVSRAVRAANAAAMARGAVEEIRAWCEQQTTEMDAADADKSNPEDHSQGALDLAAAMRHDRRQMVDEFEGYCDELEDKASQTEDAEFPGMMG